MIANDQLTRQEQNILALVAQGKRNSQIARELYLSVRTVECHLRNVFQKLGVSSRTEAAVFAFHAGFLVQHELSHAEATLDEAS